ncbi:MAG: sugar phosphate isomerase/epimerase [Proteiniphilum sp.]|nr:sugar phosphate isomerase/epimerase [Proteiniphilum sp.]
MRKILILFTTLALFTLSSACNANQPRTKAEKAGWKLSMQSYTLHRFTAVEALDKTQQLGLKYIEIYPGQKMGGEFGEAVFGYTLSGGDQAKLKAIAAEKGIKIISSGVWTAQRDEWEKIFRFAKEMELEFISAEPALDDWDVVEELARDYKMKVAVHNHPNEQSYWKPEILLNAIENRSELLGSCADVGHFKRMDLDPLACIKQLKGRIIALHFKDIAPVDPDSTLEDVVWGTGVLNVKAMLEELKHQGFKGYFTIEYEANWENNLPEIKESINYFNEVVEEIF